MPTLKQCQNLNVYYFTELPLPVIICECAGNDVGSYDQPHLPVMCHHDGKSKHICPGHEWNIIIQCTTSLCIIILYINCQFDTPSSQ